MSGLATAQYWDDYYRQSPHDTFDWYLPNQLTLHRVVAQLQTQADKLQLAPGALHLLQVGCGSSALTAQLVAAGYTRLTNIDFSPSIIAALQRAATAGNTSTHPPTVTFHCMDTRSLALPSASFHFVLDKGTLDCCALQAEGGGEGGTSESSATRMLDEVWRVLRPGGVFMCFSVHGYEARMGMMEGTAAAGEAAKRVDETKQREQREAASSGSGEICARRAWDVQYHTLDGPLEMPEQQHTYLYICTKWRSKACES